MLGLSFLFGLFSILSTQAEEMNTRVVSSLAVTVSEVSGVSEAEAEGHYWVISDAESAVSEIDMGNDKLIEKRIIFFKNVASQIVPPCRNSEYRECQTIREVFNSDWEAISKGESQVFVLHESTATVFAFDLQFKRAVAVISRPEWRQSGHSYEAMTALSDNELLIARKEKPHVIFRVVKQGAGWILSRHRVKGVFPQCGISDLNYSKSLQRLVSISDNCRLIFEHRRKPPYEVKNIYRLPESVKSAEGVLQLSAKRFLISMDHKEHSGPSVFLIEANK